MESFVVKLGKESTTPQGNPEELSKSLEALKDSFRTKMRSTPIALDRMIAPAPFHLNVLGEFLKQKADSCFDPKLRDVFLQVRDAIGPYYKYFVTLSFRYWDSGKVVGVHPFYHKFISDEIKTEDEIVWTFRDEDLTFQNLNPSMVCPPKLYDSPHEVGTDVNHLLSRLRQGGLRPESSGVFTVYIQGFKVGEGFDKKIILTIFPELYIKKS